MNNRVVLITGAAKRAGRAFAEYFSERGAAVIVHYSTSAADASELIQAIRRRGGQAMAIRADLRDASQVKQLVSSAFQAFGRLDVLVNNASIFDRDTFPDFAAENLDAAWQVNYRAPILAARSYYDLAKHAGTIGVVVNVVDQKVTGAFHRDHFTYTAGKAGLGNMTKMLAISAWPILRVNAVYPGLMLESDDQTSEDFAYAREHATPLGVIATPNDVAEAIDLLTGPAYNGVDFIVDGGQHLIRRTRDVLYEYRAPEKEP